MIIVLGVFSLGLASASAEAETIRLRSAEGMDIVLDYQIGRGFQSGNENWSYVSGLRIRAEAPGLSDRSKARAVIINRCEWQSNHAQAQEVFYADLDPVDGDLRSITGDLRSRALTAALPHLEIEMQHTYRWNDLRICTQQIAIVVDGQWQTDPVNQSHNFNFEF